jgi:hypothetical protein
MTSFLEFVLRGCAESLKEIKKNITFFIRKHALRDFYDFLRKTRKITQMQHDLLKILLEYSGSISIKDLNTSPFDLLYRAVSDRTAKRDIKKLQENRLLIPTDSGAYDLNNYALEG